MVTQTRLHENQPFLHSTTAPHAWRPVPADQIEERCTNQCSGSWKSSHDTEDGGYRLPSPSWKFYCVIAKIGGCSAKGCWNSAALHCLQCTGDRRQKNEGTEADVQEWLRRWRRAEHLSLMIMAVGEHSIENLVMRTCGFCFLMIR